MSTIKIKRGNSTNLGSLTLLAGEPAFTLDTKKFYIGDGTTNVLINPDTVANANKLTVGRNISVSGDVTAPNALFDGSSDIVLNTSLPNVGTPGTYTKVTTDAKGRITNGTNLAFGDLPSINLSNLSDTIITSAASGQLLQYNGTKWVNITPTYISNNQIINVTGDATGSGSTAITLTLKNVGTAGSYYKVTTDAQGRVTSGNTSLVAADIPSLDWSKLTTGKPTTLAGYGITDALNINGGTLTGTLTLAGDPTLPLQAATKQYVDNAIQGLDVKQSVRAATTTNITLSGLQTIDGVALANGDRVLVKDQTDATKNGIYVVSNSAWTRANDANSSTNVTPELFTFVESGTTNANAGFTLMNEGPITVGTTSLTFSQFSGAGQITAGSGLSKNGNTLFIPNSGVTSGQYTKLTVNAQGIVTTGTNLVATDIPSLDWSKLTTGKPTTLAGYGITDAAPINSPALTGNPTAPTVAASDNSTAIATTAFVKSQNYITSAGAPVQSVAGKTGAVTLTSSDVGLGNVTNESKATMFTNPTFTGTAIAPTPLTSDNSTKIATTAYVQAQGYLVASSVIDGGTF